MQNLFRLGSLLQQLVLLPWPSRAHWRHPRNRTGRLSDPRQRPVVFEVVVEGLGGSRSPLAGRAAINATLSATLRRRRKFPVRLGPLGGRRNGGDGICRCRLEALPSSRNCYCGGSGTKKVSFLGRCDS